MEPLVQSPKERITKTPIDHERHDDSQNREEAERNPDHLACPLRLGNDGVRWCGEYEVSVR
jgi:hypothetical protein